MRTRLPTANDEWNSRLSTGPAVCAPAAARVRFLHLAENLRLADDERVEAGGDAEQVPRRVEVGDVVEVRRERRARSTPWNSLMNAARSARAAVDVVARGVELGAVAGRDTTASRATPRPPAPAARVQPARLEVEPLAQLDGRGAMTEADEEEMHRYPC